MRIDTALERIGLDKGTKFLLYLVQHTNPGTKIFNRTYKQIQSDIGISQVTISRYFKSLEENSLIFRVPSGGWFVPAVIGDSDTADGPEWYVESKR